MTRRKNPEQAFQISLVRDLRRILPSDVFLTAFPAGGGGLTRGKFLKAMGLVPGVPDLMLIYEGEAYFMELKAGNGRLSDVQTSCAVGLYQAGARVTVVRTLSEALERLEMWQIPTKIARVEIARAA